MTARATFRLLRTAALVAGLALPLAACESFDLTNLIPDSKKKLPGERREVFPEGVPGVSKGVPPELMKGYQAQPETAAAPAEPEPKPAPKQAAKPKPKPQPKPTPSVAPEYQQGQAQQGQGQWPGQQQKPAQQSAWPQSPQPGTFSR